MGSDDTRLIFTAQTYEEDFVLHAQVVVRDHRCHCNAVKLLQAPPGDLQLLLQPPGVVLLALGHRRALSEARRNLRGEARAMGQ